MAKQKRSKRSDGRLKTSFTYNGKRYYVYGRTAQELKENEIAVRLKAESGKEDHDNPTLEQYYERFTENRRGKVKEMTLRSEWFRFRNCADVVVHGVNKKLGQMRMTDIKPADVQEVQKVLEKSGRTTETVNNCMDHLSHVFKSAVRDETIEKNPCRCIERLRRTEEPARNTIHRALTEEETRLFFIAAKGNVYYNNFVLMIQSGMRIGEIGALLASDVDFNQMTIRVSKTVTKDELGAYVVGDTPKTDAGNRVIPMTEEAAKCIRDQKNYNRLVFGGKVTGQLFMSTEGALLREYMVNRQIAKICKQIGIEKFTCHAFRATFATRFIEQRPQDYKILSEILGHSNTKITLDLYTHAMQDRKVQAMRGIRIQCG